ncbi:hypothetical protein HD554DRAFT_2332114 [Boletus coccyginus]|nr:hypothetical protein HD554DRAFT_2332114 [Boletus coccyginus]
MQHPQDFPDLPVRDFWQADILQAHMIIQQSCQHALEVLRQEDSGDPLRLRIHADHIRYQMIPLFGVLQTEVEDMEWAEESAHRLGELFCALSDAALTAAGQDWDHAITRALSGCVDAEDEADMDLDDSDAEFSDEAAHSAWPPSTTTGKGKAPAQLVTVLELSTEYESDNSDVRVIGTTAATEQFNPARQASLVATTSDEVAPSQSTIPRSIATSTVPPASESDDDFFFTHLIAREPVNAATTGSKRPRHVSLSELASESHPSGPGPSGKRIKSENYRTSGLNLKDSEDEAFDDSQVAKAGPSGSRTQIGRRSTTPHCMYPLQTGDLKRSFDDVYNCQIICALSSSVSNVCAVGPKLHFDRHTGEGVTHIASFNSGWGHGQHAKLGGVRAAFTRLRGRPNQDSSRSNDGGESELHVEIEVVRKYGLLALNPPGALKYLGGHILGTISLVIRTLPHHKNCTNQQLATLRRGPGMKQRCYEKNVVTKTERGR